MAFLFVSFLCFLFLFFFFFFFFFFLFIVVVVFNYFFFYLFYCSNPENFKISSDCLHDSFVTGMEIKSRNKNNLQ